MTETLFDQFFTILLGHEGAYTDRRSDPGNWTGGRVGVGLLKGTNWGISAAAYPDVDIKNITREVAKAIYERDYFKGPRIDRIKWDGIAYAAFDAQVNAGRGIKFLQMAVGAAPDGVWGPRSAAALDAMVNGMGVEHVILEQNAFRIWHWMRLDNMDDTYGLGWSRRGLDVDRRAMEFHRMQVEGGRTA